MLCHRCNKVRLDYTCGMYEVEIKSLLGSKDNAQKLKTKLVEKYPGTKLVGNGKQLNHYFNLPKDLSKLTENIVPIISKEKRGALENILKHGQKISIRTRQTDTKVILVLKASVGAGTRSNGVKRLEFESPVSMTLDKLDKILLKSGCTYQAKWSREREEYESGDMHVCIDKNAGYGYLAEFEKVIHDDKELESARQYLLGEMEDLGFVELLQDRLERMFDHYNKHWSEYYGTDKTFVIE
jgi:adenylate cyclase class IV